MKKQLILIFAVLLVISALFTACVGGEKTTEPEPHECVTGTWVIVSYPTDTTEGLKQKVCVECGKVLLTEALPCSEDLKYELVNDCCYWVAGIGNCTDTEIVIPAIYEGLPVIGVKNGAFNGYTAVVSVTFGDRIVEIQANAFNNCTSLTKVILPKSVAYIADGAFNGCTLLQDVYYDGEVEEWLGINFAGTKANPTCNGTNLYFNNKLVTNLVIPDEVIEISPFAFINCKSLVSLDVHDSVRSIAKYAFADCANLANVQLGKEVNVIYEYAFSNCVKLVEVVIPDNLRQLDDYAFNKCTSLETFTFGDSLEFIDPYVFKDCSSLRTINISSAVKIIEANVFENCQSLEYINYEGDANDWASIRFMAPSSNPMQFNKAKAYFGGELVKHVVIDKATRVNNYAFYKNSSIESVVLGDSVASVGAYSFQGCTMLESVKLNGNIETSAFADCTYLETVEFGLNVKSIGTNVFSNCKYLESITYAGNSVEWEAVTKGSGWNPLGIEVVTLGAEPEPEVDPDAPADAE